MSKEHDMNVASSGGLRDNKGKARLSFVPSELEEAVAEVIFKSSVEAGGKYPLGNWKKGLPFSQVAESAMRHLKKYAQQGEDFDAESGLPHLAHAACNIAFLLWYTKNRPEMDDRQKEPNYLPLAKVSTDNANKNEAALGQEALKQQQFGLTSKPVEVGKPIDLSTAMAMASMFLSSMNKKEEK